MIVRTDIGVILISQSLAERVRNMIVEHQNDEEKLLPTVLEIPAKDMDEPRFLVIWKIAGKYWSGIITYRNENIRIISVRKSRDEDIELYES
jgi:uncharacterized DUF497 family protein